MAVDPHDEEWAVRRAFRRIIHPDDARFWAYMLAIGFTLLITFVLIFLALRKIFTSVHTTHSIM